MGKKIRGDECLHCDYEYGTTTYEPLRDLFLEYEEYMKDRPYTSTIYSLIDYIRTFKDTDEFEEQLKALLWRKGIDNE